MGLSTGNWPPSGGVPSVFLLALHSSVPLPASTLPQTSWGCPARTVPRLSCSLGSHCLWCWPNIQAPARLSSLAATATLQPPGNCSLAHLFQPRAINNSLPGFYATVSLPALLYVVSSLNSTYPPPFDVLFPVCYPWPVDWQHQNHSGCLSKYGSLGFILKFKTEFLGPIPRPCNFSSISSDSDLQPALGNLPWSRQPFWGKIMLWAGWSRLNCPVPGSASAIVWPWA